MTILPRRLLLAAGLVGRRTIERQVAAVIVGAVVYYQLISVCLAIGLPPGDLKIATGVFVLILLAGPSLGLKRSGAQPREAFRE